MTNDNAIDLNGADECAPRLNNNPWAEKRKPLLDTVKAFSHLPVNTISKTTGITNAVVRSCLRDLGIAPVCKASAVDYCAAANAERHRCARFELAQKVKVLFDEGNTVNGIAKMLSVGRAKVYRCLDDLGIKRPTISDGNVRSAALASPDQRRARAAAAHRSVRAAGVANTTRIKNASVKASTKQYVGFGEREIIAELGQAGIEFVSQAAVDGYNIDILCGNLAVEVHPYKAGPLISTQRLRRTVKLLSSGYSVLYIWLHDGHLPSRKCLDNLVAFCDIASRNPSPLGQYRVIRGDGEIYSRASADIEDLAAVFSAYSRVKG